MSIEFMIGSEWGGLLVKTPPPKWGRTLRGHFVMIRKEHQVVRTSKPFKSFEIRLEKEGGFRFHGISSGEKILVPFSLLPQKHVSLLQVHDLHYFTRTDAGRLEALSGRAATVEPFTSNYRESLRVTTKSGSVYEIISLEG